MASAALKSEFPGENMAPGTFLWKMGGRARAISDNMVRRHRLFRPPFVVSLLALVASSFGAFLLHGIVVGCTVGFNNSSQPLGAGLASRCPGAEIGSAVLVTVALVAGALVVWLGVRFVLARQTVSRQDRAWKPPSEGEDRPSPQGPWARLLGWPALYWVCLFVAIFFAATFSAASWQYLHLTGGYPDLVINQQALSSTVLGNKPYPLYESINCGRHGQCSFLLVHQAFVAFGVALVYGAAPTPFVLFALQSLVLGLGGIPLYLLSLDILRSRRWSLVVAGTYLVWLPLFMMASIDSFHWEAFLPVEMLTIFWLWNRHRFLTAVPVVLLSFLTEEVAPVLVFFIGLYFVWPWLVKAVRNFWHAVTVPSEGPPGAPSRIRLWFRWIRTALRVPEVYASLALLAVSLIAYVILRLFEQDGGWLLGLPPALSRYVLPVSSPNKVFVFSTAGLSFEWTAKVWYWIVIFLTLGFVPFFAPRSLILVLPWVVFTFFNVTTGFWTLGDQYPFIPAAALLIGFTLGLGQLLRWTSARTPASLGASSSAATPQGAISGDSRSSGASTRRSWALDRRRASRISPAAVTLSVAVTAIIAGNLFLNPLNPVASTIVPNLGPPFPAAYGLASTSPPNDQALQQLVSLIPKNAIVAAPRAVYTLVADDPHAYPMTFYANPPLNLSLLPGNEAQRVQFVLLPYNTPGNEIYPMLWNTLYNRSDFAVRGCVSNSAAGPVELFEWNFTGQPLVFGPADPLCPNYFAENSGLAPGPNSTVQIGGSSPSGVVIQSNPSNNNTLVFSGPNIALPAGHYDYTIVLSATASGNRKYAPNETLLSVNVAAMFPKTGESSIFTTQLNVSSVCSPCGPWYNGTGAFHLKSPTSSLTLAGTVRLLHFTIRVAYIVIVPAP